MAQQAPFQPLTRREREILTLLSQNLTDREIAERLVLAQTTVKWFNRQIFNKLGVERREQAVERAIALGILEISSADAVPRHNLPAPVTPFVGRAEELADVRRWLDQPHTRLLTLLAPGGMGKTRLAIEVARSLLDDFIDGVYFVPLVGLISSDLIISTIADVFGLQILSDGRSPIQQLFQALRRKRLLFILDNFEHLLDSAPLIVDLLNAAPNVRILLTSRERLNVSVEVVYPLTGLQTTQSETDGVAPPDDATQLFVTCAQRSSPHFTAGDAQSIIRVCRLVQGMPLAIELAAAWAGTLSAAEIAAEVAQSADFLRTTMSDVPERLRSVRVVFEAAWTRLTDDARQGFRRMSVFRGGCTREAAQAVTGASLADLVVLVDKALLWRNARTERYEVHELLRQYAEQELNAAGETDATRQAHQQYYARFAQTWGEAMLEDKFIEGMAKLDADENNIREALAYATQHATPEAIEPFTDLWMYYDIRSRWEEGDRLFIAAGNAIEPHDSLALAKLLTGRSVFYERLLRWDQELEVSRRSYEMSLRLGARRSLPLAMIVYGDALRDLERHDEALPLYQQGLAFAREIDFPMMVAICTYHLANEAAIRGRSGEAATLMMEARIAASKLNNLWGLCFILIRLAFFAREARHLDEAQRLYHEAIESAHLIHHDFAIEQAMIGLSVIAREKRDWQTVYQLNREILRTRLDKASDPVIFGVLLSAAEAACMLDDLAGAERWTFEAVQRLKEWQVEVDFLQEYLVFECIQLLFVTGAQRIRAGDYPRGVVLLTAIAARFESLDYFQLIMKPLEDRLAQLLDECRMALAPDRFLAAHEQGKALSLKDALAELSLIL